jgi:hypothetical protein
MNIFRQPSSSLVGAVEGKVIYVLVLVILVQTIYPMTISASPIPLLIYQVMYAMLIISGILIARDSPLLTGVLIILGICWMISGVIFTYNRTALWAVLLSYVVIAPFQAMVIWVLMHFIFMTRRVTRDVLYAAVAVYFLIGAFFVPVYGLIENLTFAATGGNHAFSTTGMIIGEIYPWQNFVYYSYVTLTTMGYGDILPVTLWARSAASIEAIIGVLYTTIIMARLVSLYVTNENPAPNQGDLQ